MMAPVPCPRLLTTPPPADAAVPAAAATDCSVDEPGKFYVGRVTKAESGRRVPSVEMQFVDDASKYW